MTNRVVIRIVGNYTITKDPGGDLYCNDIATSMAMLSEPMKIGDREIVALVDTKSKGANGKNDKIGLSHDEVQAIMNISRAYVDDFQRRYRETHAAEITQANEMQRKAAQFDRGNNEGGDGYNPHRAEVELDFRDNDRMCQD